MAVTPVFGQGVTAYKQGRYSEAADLFNKDLVATPKNGLSHYYLGLCLHMMAQVPEATQQYRWILANSADAELIRRAKINLQVLAKTPPRTPPPAHVEQAIQADAEREDDDEVVTTVSNQQAFTNITSSFSASTTSDQPRIVDIYTDWCTWCKRFEPSFTKAQQKYAGRLNMQRINAESKEGLAMVKRYWVRGYPTILFFDNNGKLLHRIDGAPQSFRDFDSEITSTYKL